jgi:CheY-like chemotaxis protein
VTPATERIRVLIVDDHGLYRRGLQTVLAVENDIEVVAQAADGVEAVRQAEQCLPDVIVMDVGMPKRGGIDACRIIKQRVPSVLILMLTGSDDDADLFEAIRAGADGYLLKDVIEDIGAGIRGVANGESQLSPAMGAATSATSWTSCRCTRAWRRRCMPFASDSSTPAVGDLSCKKGSLLRPPSGPPSRGGGTLLTQNAQDCRERLLPSGS